MIEIKVSEAKVKELPMCWQKFCGHCSSLLWSRKMSIDQIIRQELIPFNAELIDDGPGLGYRVVFPNDRDYFWFSIAFS